MTQREFFVAISEAEVAEELRAYAAERVEKLDAANAGKRAKSAEKRAEKEVEKAPIRAALFEAIGEEPQTATMLIEAAGLEIKPQSVPSLIKPLVEEGKVAKVDVKVKGKGTQRGYVLA